MKTAMNWSVSTITFRMCLYSPSTLVRMARRCGFAGIELWEQYWRNTEADFRYWREKHPEVKFVAFSAVFVQHWVWGCDYRGMVRPARH
jgi:hypothetical protein